MFVSLKIILVKRKDLDHLKVLLFGIPDKNFIFRVCHYFKKNFNNFNLREIDIYSEPYVYLLFQINMCVFFCTGLVLQNKIIVTLRLHIFNYFINRTNYRRNASYVTITQAIIFVLSKSIMCHPKATCFVF